MSSSDRAVFQRRVYQIFATRTLCYIFIRFNLIVLTERMSKNNEVGDASNANNFLRGKLNVARVIYVVFGWIGLQ